ncbi:MAG: SGNH/GDSL hydrolase family protein, partial [Silvanigrellales bacterium]|nr:SGNH/GDSL hydrolase family protein [Silvanigrellales bacterium]
TRFMERSHRAVEGVQFSIVGGGMDTINSQFKVAEQDARQRGSKPDYIVFDFGAVDFIVKPENFPFEREYQRNFETLLKRNSGARILVLTIPDIVSLLSASSQPVGVSVPLLGPLTCDKIRKTLNLGTELGLNPEASREKIAALQARRERMNQSIERAVRNALATTAFSGRVVVSPPYAIDTSADGGNQLTFDCMHPSVNGLESIAEQTWNAAEEGGLFLR